MDYEKSFYEALSELFVGGEIEGEGGFVNLMRIKSKYFSEGILPELKRKVEEVTKEFPDFRGELFEKLYSFFEPFFSKNGCVYFANTPAYKNIYEKVYTDDKDVILFWKTHMLYYVKTDRLFRSLDVKVDDFKFFFDVSKLEHKKNNEKRELVYRFKEKREDGTIVLEVLYSENGKKTKIDDILKHIKDKKLSEEILEKAIRIFESQSEVDYFINKNAREFLKEQFDLWMYQYVFKGETQWNEKRVKELQALREIAYSVIEFIAQFENELVKIWNKPKFVLKSNYVISLDRIAQKNGWEVLKKLTEHKGWKEQVKEWIELELIEREPESIFENTLNGLELKREYRFLPIDTKYFKDLEYEILALFDNLDEELDGWLIKSENYQALNTILPKFREKVQTIYIDPPFNKEDKADYYYNTKYKDSTWATMLENRLSLAREFLKDTGSIFVRCDYNGNWIVRPLMDEIFGRENFRNEIILKRTTGMPKREFLNMEVETEYLIYYAKNASRVSFNQLWEDRKPEWMPVMIKYNRGGPTGKPIVIEGREYNPPEGYSWAIGGEVAEELYRKGKLKIENDIPYVLIDKRTVGTNWTDIPGYVSPNKWGLSTENHEKVLKRCIKMTSNEGDLVMDFFLGSGTTCAVAHKLRRKWIGIEMGEHFYSIVLPRMKKVLAYDKSGISKDKDVKQNYNKNKAGGFFKYYELEQYEDTLRKAVYKDSDLFKNPYKDPSSQYIFMKDIKLLECVELDYENNKVKIDLSKLYKDIDLPETLSNLLGKYIKKISPDRVEFEDGTEIDLKDLDYRLIKSLVWW